MNIFADPEQSRVPGTHKTVSGPRIGHVNLWVADLSRSINFYCDVLRLSVSYYGPSIGLPTVFLTLGDYHYHVALNWFYSVGDRSDRLSPCGLNHFAILYPDEVSLARAVTCLLEFGDLIYDARDRGGSLSVYIRDPDGNGIELYYDRPRTHWFDSSGEFVCKSEPFDVRKWLNCVWAGSHDDPCKRTYTHSLEATI
jgi:catechol 2,3-dioxygenase